MAEGDVIQDVNQQIVGAVSNIDFLNVLGWIVFAIVIIGGAVYLFIMWDDKRKFNRKIVAHENIGGVWIPTINDIAKTIKIGKGGFEILYLKKLKTWKIATGSRVGRNTYYFYIMPDGYWYNGVQDANLYWLDEKGGRIPVKTTSPSMRGQYTSLEKQIENLHGDKIKFWDKYGSWILSMAFILIAGVMLWLNWKEFASVSGGMAGLVDRLTELVQQVGNMASNIQQNQGGSGLVPA